MAIGKKKVVAKVITSKKTAQSKANTKSESEMYPFLKSLLAKKSSIKKKAVKKLPAKKNVVKKQSVKKAINKNRPVNKASVKKDTVKSKDIVIKKSDLKAYTLEQMMNKSYGKKGTKTRVQADKKIKRIAGKLLTNKKPASKIEIKKPVDLSKYFSDAEKKRSEINFKRGYEKIPKPYAINIANTSSGSILFGSGKTIVKPRIDKTLNKKAPDSAKTRLGKEIGKKHTLGFPKLEDSKSRDFYKIYTSDILSPVKLEDNKIKMEVNINPDFFLSELEVGIKLKSNLKRLKKGDKLCLIFKPSR